jgi:hypothetical protein
MSTFLKLNNKLSLNFGELKKIENNIGGKKPLRFLSSFFPYTFLYIPYTSYIINIHNVIYAMV